MAAKQYLERLGCAEYGAFRASKAGRRGRSAYVPSAYHSALIECLDRNDEQAFKALKMREGYASALGV